jgi:hypothetical protein
MVSFNAEYARLAAMQTVMPDVRPDKVSRAKENQESFWKQKQGEGKGISFEENIGEWIQDSVMGAGGVEANKMMQKFFRKRDVGENLHDAEEMEKELDEEIAKLGNPNIQSVADLEKLSMEELQQAAQNPAEALKLLTFKLMDILGKAYRSKGSTQLAYLDEAAKVAGHICTQFNPYYNRWEAPVGQMVNAVAG